MTTTTGAAPMSAEPVAYRLRTGSDRRKWQWMDGTPSMGAMREAELHGWEIEYAYGAAAVAAMTEREAALVAELTMLCNTIEGCGLEDLPPELEAGVCFARRLLARAEARDV